MHKPMRLALMLLLGAAVILSCGCGRNQQSPQSLPEVGTITVRLERVVLTTDLPGRTSAFLVAEIRPQVNGIIQNRLFTEGADVKAGQMLYQIDPAPFQASLNSAQAAVAKAEANLALARLKARRSEELLSSKAVSQQEHDEKDAALKQAEADLESAKASAETARINLAYTRVTAPIAGRIGKSSVTDGALVTAYQATALATVQQLDPIYVDVPQSTADLFRLRRRMENGSLSHAGNSHKKVRAILHDNVEYPLEGTLEFRDVTVEQTTGSVTLRIIFPNPHGVLLPGMFVRTVVTEGINEQAILIPQQSVSRDYKGNPSVLIVDSEGKVQQRMLTLDRTVNDKWLVASGLASGDRVVVEGVQKVRPGVTVKTVNLDPPQEKGHKMATTEVVPGRSH
jgi:membrane fusion protein, multidrug efflux system